MAVGIGNVGSLSTGTGNLTPGVPSGSNGDTLVLFVICTAGNTVTTPSGWTRKYDQVGQGSSSSAGHRISVFYRTRDGSEGSSVTVTISGGFTSWGFIATLTGTNAGDPIGAYQCIFSQAAITSPIMPGIQVLAGGAAIYIQASASTFTSAATMAGDSQTWSELIDSGANGFYADCGLNPAANGDVNVNASAPALTGGSSASPKTSFAVCITPAGKADHLIISGASSEAPPTGASAVRMQCWGGGGAGTGNTGADGGGGGGGFSQTDSISCTSSDTIFWSVGAGGASGGSSGSVTWARKGTNSQPSSTTDGCLAGGGGTGNAVTTGGAGASTSGAVGDTTSAGGTGGNGAGGGGSRAGGGGGSSAGPNSTGGTGGAASSNTPGTGSGADNTGGSMYGPGGNGGVAGAAGRVGQEPGGGGGGGGNSSGAAGAGGRGQVRLIYTVSTGPTITPCLETDTALQLGLGQKVQFPSETDTALQPAAPKVVIGTGLATSASTANPSPSYGPELISLPDIDATTNWTLAGSTSISGGQLHGGTAGGNAQYVESYTGGVAKGKVDPFVLEIDVATLGDTLPYIAFYANSTSFFINGSGARTTDAYYLQSGLNTFQLVPTGDISAGGNILFVVQQNPSGTAEYRINRFSFRRLGPPILSLGIPLPVETDTSLPRGLAMINGQSLETDTAFAPSGPALAHGFSTETDTAFNRAMALAHGFSTETDTALATAQVQIRPTGLATETDTSLALTQKLIRATGLATETDATFALGMATAHGFSSETDTSFPRGLATPDGRSNETDTAFALAYIPPGNAVGMASETDTAVKLNATNAIALGMASETDTGFALTQKLISATGLAAETDTGLALARLLLRTTGLGGETDSSFALGFKLSQATGRADETDTALTLTIPLVAREGYIKAVNLKWMNDRFPKVFVKKSLEV